MSESTEGTHPTTGPEPTGTEPTEPDAAPAAPTEPTRQRGEPAAAARRCVPGSPGHGTGRCSHRRPAPRAGSAQPSGRDAAGPPARATTCCHARTRAGTDTGEHAAAARPCRPDAPPPEPQRPALRSRRRRPTSPCHHLLPRPNPGRYRHRRARSRRSPPRRRTRQPLPRHRTRQRRTRRCHRRRPDRRTEPDRARGSPRPPASHPGSAGRPGRRRHSPCRGEPRPRQPRCERRRGVRADRRRGHGARAPRRRHRAGRRPVGRRRTR